MVSCSTDNCQQPNNPNVIVNNGKITVNPAECYYALRNPMKGHREFYFPDDEKEKWGYPYIFCSLIKEYMQWNMLEDKESDGVDKIIAYSNHRWKGVEDLNVKVIPRIYIVWREPWHGGVQKNTYTDNPDDLNGWHWPSDIPGQTYSENPKTPISGGYFSANFQERVKKLVEKAGEAWDNDPRVAYVEMGIIGEWGEHHDPNITTYWLPHDQYQHVENRTWIPGIKKTLGDAFVKAFKNKKVMVRYAYDFPEYDFGIYWDSFGMPQEQDRGYAEMKKLNDRWKTQPMGGEIAKDWGDFLKYDSFESLFADTQTRNHILECIRSLHVNHLGFGGITNSIFNNNSFYTNVESIQKVLGYRFVLSNFTYPERIEKDVPFNISFDVVNTGSSPFYYDWPVEVALLDKNSHKKVWGKILENVCISKWLPGENWNATVNQYAIPAPINHISKNITLDTPLNGQYIISISVLDPAGMTPSLRFATINYFEGGQHPMGYIGVNKNITNYAIDSKAFFLSPVDRTLKYKLK